MWTAPVISEILRFSEGVKRVWTVPVHCAQKNRREIATKYSNSNNDTDANTRRNSLTDLPGAGCVRPVQRHAHL